MTNTEPPRTEPAPADRDWFGGRRWTGIAAIGFVIVVVLCVVLLVVVGRHRHTSSGTGPGPPAAPGAVSSGTLSTPTAALPTTVPTTAPAGVTWSIYQTVALPSLPGAGPAKVTGAIATGYAHTPLGALSADVNEGNRYLLAPDREWRQAASQMLSPGVGYDAWLKVRAGHPYGSGGAAGTDVLSQIAGFQFVSYTPSDAVIQIVTRDSSGTLQVGADHVSWHGSDWKFVPAPDGSQDSNVQTVDSLAGFTEWRGV